MAVTQAGPWAPSGAMAGDVGTDAQEPPFEATGRHLMGASQTLAQVTDDIRSLHDALFGAAPATGASSGQPVGAAIIDSMVGESRRVMEQAVALQAEFFRLVTDMGLQGRVFKGGTPDVRQR